MRIAIVNDSVMAVEALRRAVTSAPENQVAWIARDGAEAVTHCVRDRPDLVLMDLMMPVMGGVEATRHIMAQAPCPILVVTATVTGNSAKVFEALGAGALDAVSTPAMKTGGTGDGVSSLLYKISMLGRSSTPPFPVSPNAAGRQSLSAQEHLIAIGSSAGGPAALAVVLAGLPFGLRAAVVIVQHLDAQFAPGLASWLSEHSKLPVRVAREGDPLQAGTVLVAGTNDHLVLKANGALGYTSEPADCSYRPSVDVFFDSVQRRWKGKMAGAILTGMGRDGARGLKALRDAGAFTIAQSRDGCVVYGMPKAAAELNAASEILPLEKIGPALARHFATLRA